MSELLDLSIAAHGGQQRWDEIHEVRAHAKIGGAVWHLKGWPDVYADVQARILTKQPHTEYAPFQKDGQHCVWEPARTAVIAKDGKVLSKLEEPRASFAGHSLMTHWNEQQLIYFSGYAMWTYLTTPFLFTLPGFEIHEVEPWDEDGETWRRLKVTFPKSVPSHSTEQTFYFGPDGLLRRHDYSVEIMGGTSSANYASEYKEFGGIVFPTKRRVYSIGTDNRPNLDRVAVSIDLLDIEIA